MDKSTKNLLSKVSALQASVKEGKTLCLESAAMIKVQRDMIDELVEALEIIAGWKSCLSQLYNEGTSSCISALEVICDKAESEVAKAKDQSS